MKRTMLPVLFVMALMISVPAVCAAEPKTAMESLVDATTISISLTNYDPNPAIAGDTVDVRIGIKNIGGMDITDLMMEIVPSYPFELVPGENAIQDVGIVQGYEANSNANIKIVKYMMKINKDTPAGSYELKVKYYQQGSTEVIQKSLYLDVKSRESAEVIHIDKSTLVPGKQSSLKFTINNVGSSPLQDLTFNWENSDNIILPVGSDNTKYIRYIDIGNGTDLEYQVIADTNAQPGLYKLNLYLTYEDSISNKTKKISTIAGVYVGGGTDFDVAFSESSNGETSFSVANIGSNPAYSVSVIVPDQRNWRVSGSNSVIIGNLNKGDYTVASYKLQSPMNSSPEAIQMQIAYTDTMGERKFVEKEVKLGQNIATPDGQTGMQGRRGEVQQGSIFSNSTLYLFGIALLFLGFLAYRKYRYHKLLDPDFRIKDLFKSMKK